MFSIFKKEVNSFLSSLVGYLAIAVFLIGTGLFVWIFPQFSVIRYGFSDLSSFFALAPYVLLFLVPAITMRSLAEEQQTGTMELLLTRPLSLWQILMGKYLAAVFLVGISILPTLTYYFSVYELGFPKGNIDRGASFGAYLGLFGLGSVFCAIGIFASSLSKNQIVAFLVAFFLCAFFYEAFDNLAGLELFFAKTDALVESLGLSYHYKALSKGLVDSYNLVYLASVAGFFLLASRMMIERNK